MSILDNEGHDPQGFGNVLGRTDANDLRRLEAENRWLRQIVSDCAAALPNGAMIAPECSLDFMAKLPGEITACFARMECKR